MSMNDDHGRPLNGNNGNNNHKHSFPPPEAGKGHHAHSSEHKTPFAHPRADVSKAVSEKTHVKPEYLDPSHHTVHSAPKISSAPVGNSHHPEQRVEFKNEKSPHETEKKDSLESLKPSEESSPEKIHSIDSDTSKKTTPSASREETSLDDESLIVEEDGNFFWLIQRILWVIVKIVFIGGSLVFVIWLIWNPHKNTGSSPAPTQTSSETKTSAVKKILLPSSATTSAQNFIQLAHQIQAESLQFPQNTFSLSVTWIRKAYSFFQIPLNQVSWGQTAMQRSLSVNSFLNNLRSLINESAALRQNLANEDSFYTAQLSLLNQKLKEFSSALSVGFQNYNTPQTQELLSQKILAEQLVADFTGKMQTNNQLLLTMEPYDRALRSVYENVSANKEALIQNIQVVQFPNDPFERVITPAEWKNKSGQ